MKKFLLACMMLMASVTVWSQGQVHYRLEGSIGVPDYTDVVYMALAQERGVEYFDSLQVVNGEFVAEDHVADSLMYVALFSQVGIYFLFLEEGTLTMKPADTETGVVVTGTPLNDAQARYDLEYAQLAKQLENGIISQQQFLDKEVAMLDSVIRCHPNDWWGYDRTMQICTLVDSRRGLEYLSMLREPFASFQDAEVTRQRLLNLAEAEKGVMFKDFTDEHTGVRLSDYVGKGQYVLADFWASWCAPCVKEIPQIIKIYHQYKEKGLVVLGIAVEDSPTDAQRLVEKLGIPYPQMHISREEADEKYGVSMIPRVILFAPDGTIDARFQYQQDLRLEEILND